MAVKITFKSTLASFLPNINKDFTREMKRTLADRIVETITSGISPVTGKKFKGYSNKYAIFKGRKEPVDMVLSGNMLESLNVVSSGTNSVDISMDSPIAVFHNDLGAGTSRVIRRLLPSREGEEFTRALQNRINKAINQIVSKEVARQNR